MDRLYEQMEYDGIRPSEAYAPDGSFIALNEQNVYITHTSNSDFEIINQRHTSVEILFCEEGEADYKIDKEVYSVGKNDILIIETKGDNHMKMKHKFYIWLFCIVIVINVCWQLLELLIYGEIQPRIVDNIVGLLWTGAICFAYKFKELELKRMLKKYNKVQINATWWLRKPIPPEMYTGYASDRIWLQSEYELGNKGGFTET